MQVFLKFTGNTSNLGGPFSIIPNIGTASPSVLNAQQLIDGFTVTLSDPTASFINVKSIGFCDTNLVYNIGSGCLIPAVTGFIVGTSTTSTTTVKTNLPPTTTTTTTLNCECHTVINNSNDTKGIQYIRCDGVSIGENLSGKTTYYYCAKPNSIVVDKTFVSVTPNGIGCTNNTGCTAPPTTTSTTTNPNSLKKAPCEKGMDVIFIVDYNLQMRGMINGLKRSIDNTILAIQAMSSNNYRLGLVIVDEYRTFLGGQTPNVPAYENAPNFQSIPSSQKYTGSGTQSPNTKITQRITAVEKFSQNNATSFKSKLNQLAVLPTFPLGDGQQLGQPLDVAIDLTTSLIYPGYNYFAGVFTTGAARIVVLVTNAVPGGNNDTWEQQDINYINNTIIPRLKADDTRVVLITTEKEDLSPFAPSTNILYKLARDTNGAVVFSPNPSPRNILPLFANADPFSSLLNICGGSTITTTTVPAPVVASVICCRWENRTSSPIVLDAFTLCNPCCRDLVNFTCVPGDRIPVVEGSEIGTGFSQMTKVTTNCFDMGCLNCQ
jgi:hypothetical protein